MNRPLPEGPKSEWIVIGYCIDGEVTTAMAQKKNGPGRTLIIGALMQAINTLLQA